LNDVAREEEVLSSLVVAVAKDAKYGVLLGEPMDSAPER
jgi:hypothetical protein